MGLSPLAHLPHVKAFACDQEQAEGALIEIERQLQERKQKVDKIRRKAQVGGGFDGQAFLSQYPTLVLAMDDAFDSFDDITITSDELSKQQLREWWTRIVQQGRRLGLYLILAGSSRDLNQAVDADHPCPLSEGDCLQFGGLRMRFGLKRDQPT